MKPTEVQELDDIRRALGHHPEQLETIRETERERAQVYVEQRQAEERERGRINRSALKLLQDPKTKPTLLGRRTVEGLVPLPPEVFDLLWPKYLAGEGLPDRTRVCEVCDKEFQSVRASAKYCSNVCKQKAKRKQARKRPAKALK